MIAISFMVFLLLIFLLGIASACKSEPTEKSYYLADASVPPWLAAVSAVATLNSGYAFIGLIGFTYVAGLHSIWITVGWIFGDYTASLFVYRQLRIVSEQTGAVSYASVLANWHGEDFKTWRRIAALVIVIFLSSYAAAQITVGGKSFFATLGLSSQTGAIVTATMVLAYSAAGGLRASIWTDAAQFVIMIVAMFMLNVVGLHRARGIESVDQKLDAIPGYLDLYPETTLIPGFWGPVLFIIGWIFAGLSIIGQPHIMVRYMALESADKIGETRIWYYCCYIAFITLATSAGLLARVLLPELGDFDPELSLPIMARMLLPDVLVGLFLAGIIAATMSTVDSLVLSSSAAITSDLVPKKWKRAWMPRAATAGVTIIALAIALTDDRSVFNLVILSWSTLGSAFAPLLILYALKRRITERLAITTMIIGVTVAFSWRGLGLHTEIFEGLPGILAATLFAFAFSQPHSPATKSSRINRGQ